MDKREEIIDAMCLTWRHDFGLDRQELDGFPIGATEHERNALRMQMGQIYQHHFLPALSQARSQAYEECAKIAEKKFYPGPNGGVIGPTQESIVQAIRQHSQKGGEK